MNTPQRSRDGASPPTARSPVARNLRTIGALAALFFLPIAVSFWLYYSGWSPAAHVNHGELVQPPRVLPIVSLPRAGGAPVANVFGKRWALVYVGDGRCDSACRYALLVMRQTQGVLGNDMPRVERVFLATAHCCDEPFLGRAYPGLIVLDASAGSASSLRASFAAANRPAMIFVVDPLGNLMMRYDLRGDPKGLLQDLQRLLRLSHIG